MPLDPDRKKKNLDALERSKPNFSKFKEYDEEKQAGWLKEINALERRSTFDFVPVDLGGGQTIRIRARLTVADTTKIDKLRIEQTRSKDPLRSRDTAYEIVELLTENPMITKEWLQANPDKFSLDDMLEIAFGYYEQQAKLQTGRMEKLARAQKFRQE